MSGEHTRNTLVAHKALVTKPPLHVSRKAWEPPSQAHRTWPTRACARVLPTPIPVPYCDSLPLPLHTRFTHTLFPPADHVDWRTASGVRTPNPPAPYRLTPTHPSPGPPDNTPVSALRLRELPRLAADTPMYDMLKLFETGRSHMAVLTRPPGGALGGGEGGGEGSVDGATAVGRRRAGGWGRLARAIGLGEPAGSCAWGGGTKGFGGRFHGRGPPESGFVGG